MALTWRGRRQLMYYIVGGIAAALVAYFAYQALFSVDASCRNGVQDEGEQRIDCGGVCALVCKEDVRPAVVLWARSFEQADGEYTAAAYIQNNNPGAGARKAGYTFQLFDEKNELVVEQRGTINIPPSPIVPILHTGIDTGTRDATRTLFAFTDDLRWERATEEVPTLRIQNQRFADGKLSGTLKNESRQNVRAQVTAVLFDGAGIARAASKTTLSVPARGEEYVIFTFSPVPPGVTRAELTVLPPF